MAEVAERCARLEDAKRLLDGLAADHRGTLGHPHIPITEQQALRTQLAIAAALVSIAESLEALQARAY